MNDTSLNDSTVDDSPLTRDDIIETLVESVLNLTARIDRKPPDEIHLRSKREGYLEAIGICLSPEAVQEIIHKVLDIINKKNRRMYL